MPDKTAAQAELLFNRLVKRHKHLAKWARRTGTTAFRLYDRDIPEIPLVLDLYADAVSGALFRRPGEKSDDEENAWLTAMEAAAARALGISCDHIFLKERRRMRGRQDSGVQYEKLRRQGFCRDVKEGDLLFRVNLSDYLDTGLFLDARKKRAFIRSVAAGKKVLNLFAYTSTLSLAAAKGGAVQVDSVDLSNTYLDWGKANFALNGIEATDNFSFIRGDVLEFLTGAAKKRKLNKVERQWDIIILDPPSFSNSKKMKTTLDIKRDHRDLINRCLSLLTPDGTLYFSSNARGLALASGDFPGLAIKDIGPDLVDEDFKKKRTPVCYEIKGINPMFL